MPTVPSYEESIGEDGGMSGRVDVQAPAGAFGVDPSAVQSVATGLQTLGTTMQQLDAQHDEAVAKYGALQYGAFKSQTLYGDGQTAGYLSLQQKDALDARDGAIKALADKRDQLVSTLGGNARQRALLTQALGQQFNSDAQSIGQHALGQGLAWAKTQSAATEVGDRNSIISATVAGLTAADQGTAALQQQEAATYRTKLGMEVARNLQTTGQLSDATYQEAMTKHLTAIHSAVVDNLLSQKTATGIHQADVYFQMNQGEMDPVTRATSGAKVHEQLNAQAADDAATAATAHLSPPPPQAPAGSSAPGTVKATTVTPFVRGLLQNAGATPVEADTLVRIQQHENAQADPTLNNPLPGSTSHGIWQHTLSTWLGLGGSRDNRDDPQMQAQLALKLLRQNAAGLQTALGRQPIPAELYIAHQQGLGAAKALLTADPNANAIQTLQAAHVGNASASILNNLPKSQRPAGRATTVGQFLTSWGATAAAQGASNAVATAQPSNGVPDKDAFGASVIAGAPPGASAAVVNQFRTVADQRWNQMNAANTTARGNAYQAAVEAVINGGKLKDIQAQPGFGLLQPTQVQNLQNLIEKQGQQPSQSDPQKLIALHDLRHNDPQAFARQLSGLDPSSFSPSDWKWAVDERDDILNPDPTKAAKTGPKVTWANINSVANDVFGANTSVATKSEFTARGAKPGTPTAQAYSMFKQDMLERVQAYRDQNPGKADPDALTLRKMAGELVSMQAGLRQTDDAGNASVPKGGLEPYLKLDPTKQAYVPIAQIPNAARAQIITDFRRQYGRTPKVWETENLYAGQHARGRL